MRLSNWIVNGAVTLAFAATATAAAAHGGHGSEPRHGHQEMHRKMHGDGGHHDRMRRGGETHHAGHPDRGYGRRHHGRDDGPTLRLKMEGRHGEMIFECGASMPECLDALERVQKSMQRHRGMRQGQKGPDGAPDKP